MSEDEDIELPWKQTLPPILAQDSLIVSNACLAGPNQVHEHTENLHWDLGLSRVKQVAYWDRVRVNIEDLPTSDDTTN